MTIKSLFDLTKFRLTLSVVFSSFISYMLGFKEFDIKVLTLLIFGGIFVVAASNIYNQIIEKDLDALMSRTKNRPLPTNKISVNTALILAIFLTVIGLVLLYIIILIIIVIVFVGCGWGGGDLRRRKRGNHHRMCK